VGAELLGREFSEARLLSLAYAYEQAAKVRTPPRSTPSLSQ
jgi:Asp-tRNA(Asn)/Glu-tRNA(Gln) amidotransferase A subunit family amidase